MTNILNLKNEWRECIDACSECHNVCVENAFLSFYIFSVCKDNLRI